MCVCEYVCIYVIVANLGDIFEFCKQILNFDTFWRTVTKLSRFFAICLEFINFAEFRRNVPNLWRKNASERQKLFQKSQSVAMSTSYIIYNTRI